MTLKSLKAALLISVFVLQGCGGSDNSVDPTSGETTLPGFFLDSAVANIDYRTETQSGVTDTDGKYEYVAGETVIFSIGSLDFPPVKAAGTVTPLDIADTSDPNDNEALNMIRLLQTLDKDGDPSNGITITEVAKGAATAISSFDISPSEFESEVSSLIESGGQDTEVTELVSAAEAVAHFEDTLADTGVVFDSLTGSWVLGEGKVVFHFLSDGRFLAMQWEESNGFEGFEYGTYAASDGKITFTTRENNDGEALTCGEQKGTNCTGDNAGVWGYTLAGDTLSVSPSGEDGSFGFDRVAATNSPIDGLWESLQDKEFVYFMGGNSYFYVDYLANDAGDDATFELGSYETVTNDGKSEINLSSSKTYNSSGLDCEQTGSEPCDTFTAGYSVINQQLAIISTESSDRTYFNQLLTDDDAPANTGKLVAQKQYSSDIAASDNYSVERNDDYNTRIRSIMDREQASSVSSKFNIDDASSLVRAETDGKASLRTRLVVSYVYPGNENRDVGLALDASVRLRYFGGSASAKYVVSTCFDASCDSEVYIEKIVSNLGAFTGDHEMAVKWDNSAKAFAFTVDGSEVGRITMAEYNSEASAFSSLDAAAGNYTFSSSDYARTEFRVDVADVENGESGYIAVHVDNVTIDNEVYDNFTAGLIDDKKWLYESRER